MVPQHHPGPAPGSMVIDVVDGVDNNGGGKAGTPQPTIRLSPCHTSWPRVRERLFTAAPGPAFLAFLPLICGSLAVFVSLASTCQWAAGFVLLLLRR